MDDPHLQTRVKKLESLVEVLSGQIFTQLGRKGNAVNTSVAVSNVAALALAANPNRIQALFVNTGSVIVYLGQAGVTTATGFPVNPGGSFVDDASTSAWYAVTASAAGSLVVTEVS